jgi:hypothetical protein
MIKKIISGGQTGVDRAALDVGIKLHFPIGGWCPKGRKAEDGVLDEKYPLEELSSPLYSARTLKNVQESDGTLILCLGKLTGGTALTKKYAEQEKKPCLVIDLQNPSLEAVSKWVEENKIQVLNVAGPRESSRPKIYALAFAFIEMLLGTDRK